jgi:hypothetical protein
MLEIKNIRVSYGNAERWMVLLTVRPGDRDPSDLIER